MHHENRNMRRKNIVGQTINCLYCNGMVSADADICPHCGGPVKSAVSAAGAIPKQSPKSVFCPSCNTAIRPGDIVCVRCGTNLITGQKVVTPPDEGKKKVRSDWGKALKVGGITLLVLLAAAALVALAALLLRDPVGNARRSAKAGNLTEAADVLQQYLERNPDNSAAQFLLGQIYWQGQQYGRASEAFENVARQGGSMDKEAAMLAVLAADKTPETRDPQRLISLLTTLIQQRRPNDAELMKLAALLQGTSGAYRNQSELLDEAMALDGSMTPTLPALARALNNDLEGAEKLLQQAVATHPEETTAVAALGFVRMMRGQNEAAAAAFEQAAADPQSSALVHLQLGVLHMQRGSFGKALPLLNTAKTALPEDARAQFLHALCLQENKLYDEALVAFEKMASTSGAFSGLAALQMAVIYTEQNNLERAAFFAKKASESGLNTARQATIQGRVLAMQGELSQAEQAYQRAISMTADYPAARLELGLLLINRGAVERGLEEIDYYLELAKSDPAKYRVNEIEVLATQLKQAGNN